MTPFYGWAIVASGFVVVFCSGPGQSYVFSVFIDPIIETTGFSRTGISALYAVGTGLSAVMVGLVSRMADRYGPRLMLIVVATALGSACFLMAFSTGIAGIVIAFAALRALGQGALPINATLLTATWFVVRRGKAMAIVMLGSAASNAVLPPVSSYVIGAFDWQTAYMALGVMVWLLVIPLAIIVVRDSPEKVGLHPDGFDHPPVQETVAGGGPDLKDRKVFSTATFWLLAIPMAIPSLTVTALTFHQVSIFAEQGLSRSVAAGAFIPFAIASAGFSLAGGVLLDRYGPRPIFLINMAVLSAVTFSLLLISTPAQATIYALAMGATTGMGMLISSVSWAYYYGRHGLGRVQGTAVMISITGAALGPLPLAMMQSLTGSYTAGLIVMALLPIAGLIAFSFAHPQSSTAAAAAA